MNLNDRKTVIAIGVVMFSLLILIIPLTITPAKKKINLLDKKIAAKKSALEEMSELKREYDDIIAVTKTMERKVSKLAKNVALPSLLENVAKQSNLKNKMTGLKTHETIKNKNFNEDGVEISLREVSIDELIGFIFNLESLPYMIKVKGFKIKTAYGNAPKLINLTLLVSLFTPN